MSEKDFKLAHDPQAPIFSNLVFERSATAQGFRKTFVEPPVLVQESPSTKKRIRSFFSRGRSKS